MFTISLIHDLFDGVLIFSVLVSVMHMLGLIFCYMLFPCRHSSDDKETECLAWEIIAEPLSGIIPICNAVFNFQETVWTDGYFSSVDFIKSVKVDALFVAA